MAVSDTPVTYSAEDAARLRARFASGEGALVCPLCEGPLLVGPPFERRGRTMTELYCRDCQRCVMIEVARGDGPSPIP